MDKTKDMRAMSKNSRQKTNPKHDPVNHPSHYTSAGAAYETIRVIEAWQLNYHLGNAVKYISRAGKKGDRLEDLRKAAWYLNREIEKGE